MSEIYMLTTFDNPFDPFTEFEDWYNYDTIQLGHYSLAYQDRIVNTIADRQKLKMDELSEPQRDALYQQAVDEIIKIDPFGIYTRKSVNIPENEITDDENKTLDQLINEYFDNMKRKD